MGVVCGCIGVGVPLSLDGQGDRPGPRVSEIRTFVRPLFSRQLLIRYVWLFR